MQFQTDKYQLDNSITDALSVQDVALAVEKGIVTKDQIRSHIHSQSDRVWAAAAQEISSAYSTYEEWRKAKGAAEAKLKDFTPMLASKDSRPLRIGIALTANSRSIALVSALAILVAVVWVVTRVGLGMSFRWLSVWWHALLALAVVVIGRFALVALKRYLATLGQSLERKLDMLRETQREDEAKRIKTEYRLTELSDRSYKLNSVADNAVIEKGILPAVRMFINERSGEWAEAPYAVALPDIPVPGLAEVFDPSLEIPTEAKHQVLRLIESMPGGTIGISGPRGAGKTTLLWSLCNGSVKTIKKKEVLSVMLSAPVKYDAREFILHLFSTVCGKVLTLHNEADDTLPWQAIKRLRKAESSVFDRLAFIIPLSRRLSMWSYLLGVFILCLSGLLAFRAIERAKQETQRAESYRTQTQANAFPSPSGVSQGVTLSDSRDRRGEAPGLVEVFDLKAGSFLTLGLWLIVGSLITQYFLTALIKYGKPTREQYEKEIDQESESSNSDHPNDSLSATARRWREEIRFQQSYSSGWSGSLKLPVGLEGSLNQAVSLAQMQISLPEIVERYREFVSLASTKYQVIIAIDELDKIESDEKAQQFLNEIKAVFGVERCFYLVSVSESAMSSFERRGLPFRDVFDSAIDVMVYVDYLNQETAKRLLLSRVIGLPIPFLTFCYSFSGGLARDLLRACRDLFDQSTKSGQRDLGSLTASLVTSDSKAKIRATIAAASCGVDPGLALVLERLASIELSPSNADILVETCTQLFHERTVVAQRITESSHPPNQVAGHYQEESPEGLTQLAKHLAIYLYYSITLLEVFNLYSSSEQWKKATSTNVFDDLAGARRGLSSNPLRALSDISRLRKSCMLTTPDYAE